MKRKLVLVVVSGVLCASAMPRPGLWILSWFGLVPLLIALRGARTTAAAFSGLVFGTVYYGIVLFWIALFGYLPWVLLALAQGVFLAFFGTAAGRMLTHRNVWVALISVPAAWTVLQWVRSLGPYGFTWASFAHTQANNLPVCQLATIAGPWAIDFVVCLVNTALALIWAPRSNRERARVSVVAVTILLVTIASGQVAINDSYSHYPGSFVSVIQGNLPRSVDPPPGYTELALATYEILSLKAAAESNPDMLVWPETTLPAELSDPVLAAAVGRIASATGTYLLAGAFDRPDTTSTPGSHNAAHLFDPSGRRVDVYRKVHLVPFGEFVPLRGFIPFLERYQVREEDVVPGTRHNLLKTGLGKIGVCICFESIFPHIARKETRDGAVALFVLTNDSWFGRTQAARQHLMMSRLRAIENRKWVVRAASTGISTFIDPWGRQHGELGIFTRGVLTQRVEPRKALTPFTRFGDWFVAVCAALYATAVITYAPRLARKTDQQA